LSSGKFQIPIRGAIDLFIGLEDALLKKKKMVEFLRLQKKGMGTVLSQAGI